jgi:hypothetical protein
MTATLATLAVLALLLASLGGWALPALATDAPSATPAQLAALEEILARPEFQAAESRSFFDRLLDPIRAWVRWLIGQVWALLVRLLGPTLDAGGSTIVLATVLLGLGIVGGAALLLYRLAGGAVADDAPLATVGAGGRPRAAEELARARELARAGLARRAVHHHYRAILLRLDERDYLALDAALTNRELLPRLAATPTLAGPFAELVARFDQLWYGQTDCSPVEYAAFARLADRVWQGTGAS